MPNNEADMHRIIGHAAELAPRYLVRRIQLMEEPAPARTFSPPKVAELGDLQCFLRDYFVRRCAKWQEEKARREQLKKEIRDGPTQQLVVTAEDKRTRMGSQRGGSAGTDRRSRSESPPRSNTSRPPPSPPPPSNPPNDDTAQPQPTAELRAARAHANEIYWEVLDVMLTGVPLLHELLGGVPAEEAGASEDSSESNGRRLVPALDILDESLAEQIREVIRLRRRIEDNTDPRLDSYDLAVLEAFRAAGDRVRRAKEEATRRELDGPSR
ncbi:hypothetical protein FRC01_014689 [Tulasnella sp. 417]|nr:hypothetical protein FRC01_014689 [Tulasnella sp. 417]